LGTFARFLFSYAFECTWGMPAPVCLLAWMPPKHFGGRTSGKFTAY
jgi:hypothetical protein